MGIITDILVVKWTFIYLKTIKGAYLMLYYSIVLE